jgi:hypothetical protein
MILRSWSVTLLLALWTIVLQAGEPPFMPQQLKISIGGFTGTSYSVTLKNEKLLYWSSEQRSKTIKPTPAAWQEFRKTLDELSVWKWRDRYINKSIMDGNSWSFEISYADHSLKTYGSNSYPGPVLKTNSGYPSFTPTFNRFLAAVEQLLGGKEFR